MENPNYYHSSLPRRPRQQEDSREPYDPGPGHTVHEPDPDEHPPLPSDDGDPEELKFD